jgi:tetratricopeptide (TPR) repeat protein
MPMRTATAAILRILRRHLEALASFDAALAILPTHVEALNNRGATLEELNRYGDALASYDRALAIKPDYVDALNNRGVVLEVLLRHDEALACYDRAVTLDPDHENALTNRGHTLLDLKRYDEAIRDFERVLVLEPQAPLTRGLLLHSRMQCCDGGRMPPHQPRCSRTFGRPVTTPLHPGHADSVKDRVVRRDVGSGEMRPSSAPLWTGERYEHDRIRAPTSPRTPRSRDGSLTAGGWSGMTEHG